MEDARVARAGNLRGGGAARAPAGAASMPARAAAADEARCVLRRCVHAGLRTRLTFACVLTTQRMLAARAGAPAVLHGDADEPARHAGGSWRPAALARGGGFRHAPHSVRRFIAVALAARSPTSMDVLC